MHFRSVRSRCSSFIFNLSVILPLATFTLIQGTSPSQRVALGPDTRQGVEATPAQTLTEAGESLRGSSEDASPVDPLAGMGYAVAIAAGDLHTCALLSTGGVMCWGVNYCGQLGNGTNNGNSWRRWRSSGYSAESTAIAAGESHTCALTAAGGVECWGEN